MPAPQKHTEQTPGWHYYLCSGDAWDAMYEDCARAKESIFYEQYILENDEEGQRFMRLFIDKARAGVKVLIICDQFGSSSMKKSPLVEELRAAGGQFYFYNPVSWIRLLAPWTCFPRTHTKTLLVDCEVVYAGGVCIAARMRDWRDTQLRITGPICSQVHHAFEQLSGRLSHNKKQKKQRPPIALGDGFRYQVTHPAKNRYAIYREIKRAILQAESYIYITTAYFIPHHRFYRLLRRASRNGVDVRILVPEHSDVRLADWIGLSYFPSLLKSGIRIFLYRPTVLHSKSAVIDDKWATIGSTNFDLISFFHNREANVMVSERAAIAELKEQFGEDLNDSIEVTQDYWDAIPAWKKLLGYTGRILKTGF